MHQLSLNAQVVIKYPYSLNACMGNIHLNSGHYRNKMKEHRLWLCVDVGYCTWLVKLQIQQTGCH